MNAVSTKEASGSAAKASDAGSAMRSTSDPSSSSLKPLLRQGQIVRRTNNVHRRKKDNQSTQHGTNLMFMTKR
jgi:hypothetical protein